MGGMPLLAHRRRYVVSTSGASAAWSAVARPARRPSRLSPLASAARPPSVSSVRRKRTRRRGADPATCAPAMAAATATGSGVATGPGTDGRFSAPRAGRAVGGGSWRSGAGQ